MQYRSGTSAKAIAILIALLSTSGVLSGQYPGGVGEPVIWIYGDETQGEAQSEKVSAGLLEVPGAGEALTEGLMNYHPLWSSHHVQTRVDAQMASQSTYFIVYKPSESAHEKNIWSLEHNDTTRLIMTSRRFVDLDKQVYSEFSSSDQFRTYTHHRNREDSGKWDLTLFGAPASSDLPVVSSDIEVAELIIYDRALAERERIQVESYLALKYGLSLKHPVRTVYLDSNGDVFWSEDEHGDFVHRVTAIGRDDYAGLNNKQSSSTHPGNPVSIALLKHELCNALNPGSIGDKQYLIWSDDNGSMKLGDEYVANPSLARSWQMNRMSQTDHMTEVLLDTRMLAVAEPIEFWWLKVQRGEGLPELFRGTEQEYGVIGFDSIIWDPDGSGLDHFTFQPGGSIAATVGITHLECGKENTGMLEARAYGGTGVYTYIVEHMGQEVFRTTSSVKVDVEDLQPGAYNISILDASGDKWSEVVLISSETPKDYCVPNTMAIPQNGVLHIERQDLCAGPMAQISLESGPKRRNDEPIEINEQGTYIIRIEEEGCVSFHGTKVGAPGTDIFKLVTIYPNPVQSGESFHYRIVLQEAANVDVTLFDASGKSVANQKLGRSQVFNGSFKAPVVAGHYTLHMEAGQNTRSTQLITID